MVLERMVNKMIKRKSKEQKLLDQAAARLETIQAQLDTAQDEASFKRGSLGEMVFTGEDVGNLPAEIATQQVHIDALLEAIPRANDVVLECQAAITKEQRDKAEKMVAQLEAQSALFAVEYMASFYSQLRVVEALRAAQSQVINLRNEYNLNGDQSELESLFKRIDNDMARAERGQNIKAFDGRYPALVEGARTMASYDPEGERVRQEALQKERKKLLDWGPQEPKQQILANAMTLEALHDEHGKAVKQWDVDPKTGLVKRDRKGKPIQTAEWTRIRG